MKLSSVSQKTKNFLYGLAGFAVSFYIIYLRLFSEQPSRVLFLDTTQIQLFIYAELFLIFLSYTVFYIYIYYREKYPTKKQLTNTILLKIKYHIQLIGFTIINVYNNSLEFFDRFLRRTVLEKWFGQKDLLFNMLDPFKKIFSAQIFNFSVGIQYKWAVIIFFILPKILILFILGLDVFIFARLHYIYMAAPIYLIPLFYQYLLYIIACTISPYYIESCSKLEFFNVTTNIVMPAEEYMNIKLNCVIPYLNSYYVIDRELYNSIKNAKPYFKKEYIKFFEDNNMNIPEKEIIEALEIERYSIQYIFSDPLIIKTRLEIVKSNYMKKYKINVLTSICYTIIWGYIFFHNLYIYFT